MNRKGQLMNKTNYFIEGLQGAGKSTFVRKLSEQLKDYQVFKEGDYSPVELAWCTYVTEKQYKEILAHYAAIETQIKEKTFSEDSHKIICYTQILTDIPGFHKDLEKYEIYNGNLDKESFENVIFERFTRWNRTGQIFECSIFQNIIENQMLYLMLSDEEIFAFYRRLKEILVDKQYKIIYLDVEDIRDAINIIRKERSDERGNELWFPLMMQYLESSPYSKVHHLTNFNGLIAHLERRKALERWILEELFRENSVILRAKKYTMEIVKELLKI